MNRFRIWMMTATLLAFATTVNAQSPAALLQYWYGPEDGETPTPFYLKRQTATQPPAASAPLRRELAAVEEAAQRCCDEEAAWHRQAVERVVAAWMNLREMCQSSRVETDVEEVQIVPPPVALPARQAACPVESCPVGGAGRAKGLQIHVETVVTGPLPAWMLDCQLMKRIGTCCGVKEFVVQKQTAPCCCAKACTCCETCKAKAPPGVQAPMAPPACWGTAVGTQIRWAVPAPCASGSACLPPLPEPTPIFGPYGVPVPFPSAAQPRGWAVPMPPVPQGQRVVIAMPTSGPVSKPAHLVTPELEAHCQRIIHKDGHIILEGNVLLLCKKHAQPIRIEAPRVVVNMKDGSFVVETGPSMTTTSAGFGVMRTSGPPTSMSVYELVPGAPMMPPMPSATRVIQVVPVPPSFAR